MHLLFAVCQILQGGLNFQKTAVENRLHTKNRLILQFFNWEGIVLILPKSPLVLAQIVV